MKTIIIKCKCGVSHQVPRDKEVPIKATSMSCNYCPTCENDNQEYNEWYNYNSVEEPEIVDPNQLELF